MNDRKRLLVVDDNPDVLRILSRFLRNFADVETVQRVSDARHALQSERFDAIISDNNLGIGSGGVDLLELVTREYPSTRRMMFSASAPRNLRALLKRGVIHEFHEKPKIGELLRSATTAGRNDHII